MLINNINEFKNIYENNKRLDLIFIKKYSTDQDLYKKNCIEFLVKLSEFINETKCFKYWSIKKPNQEDLLEEFADCITMILYFYGYLDLELDNEEIIEEKIHKFDLINSIYYDGTKLMNELNEKLVKNIFKKLITLSKLFNINEEEIIIAINKKHQIIEERLSSNY